MKGMDVVMVTETGKPELLWDRGIAKNQVLHFQHLVLQEWMYECVGDCEIKMFLQRPPPHEYEAAPVASVMQCVGTGRQA